MYSENDFRYYQGGALSHAEGEKKKWNWLPGGKNPPEYNAWYYATHPEKWGITKAAKDVYNKATAAAKNTDTDLDDKALDLIGRGARAVKSGAQKVLDRTNVDERVRRYTETLQKRDTAKRKADQARANASRATSSRTADMYEREAQKYDRQAKSYDNQARTARNNAGQALKRGVTNTAESIGRSARNLGQRALNATTIDDSLREAGRNLRRGNYAGAGRAVKQAGYEAGSRAVGAVRSGAEAVGRTARSLGQRALDATTIDESLREAGSNLRRGNYAGAGRAVKQAGYEAGSRAAGAVRGVGKAARDLGQRALNSTDLDDRAVQLGRDIRDGVRGIPGRISDATGLSARNRSQQARANADELNERANADQRKAEAARKLDRDGNGQTPSGRSVENIERNAENSRAAAQRAERTAQNAESAYRSTPLGKAESTANTVKDAAGKTAEEAQRMARKEVRDAMSDYWKAVDQYGVNSPQAQRAAKKAEGTLNSTERSLINKFGNAKNTIEDTISDGINYLKERRENIQIEWDGPFSYTVTDKRRPGYSKKSTPFKDTYTYQINVPTYGTGKASKEYEEELEYNSRKNKYPRR